MRTLKVRDVMTEDVTSVAVDAPFKSIVWALATRRVSGAPVVDPNGTVVGVVSEADLLPNESRAGEHDLLHDLLHRAETRKADARVAHQLMNAPAVTVTPDTPVRKAAATLARHGYKRLPVVDDTGRLVGIVSRRDVLGMFLRPDKDITHEVEQEVLLRGMAMNPAEADVEVTDGIVTLRGQLEFKSSVEVAESLTHGVAGVVDVVNRMTYEKDDEHLRLTDPTDGTRLRDPW